MGKVSKPPPAITAGDLVLERYRVVEQIASGGHSVVFRGVDERLSRPVCIKVFSAPGGGSGLGRTNYEHFVQEAFALSKLTHPNTLRIFDFGHLGAVAGEGMPVQVCEYMNGGTLSQLVREHGRQSLAETVRVITAMCAALAEAHALGIVHRDIKPQNILFGEVGGHKLPRLADFGIAKWSADDDRGGQRAEDTEVVAGQKLAMYSPSWAAPEQLAGQPVGPATDLYSLGVVAVYMLSGKAIFADDDVYAGYKKRRQPDELVAGALGPAGVSPDVAAILSRAIAFDPGQRLTRIDELADQLRAILAAGASPAFEPPLRAPGSGATPAPPATAAPTTEAAADPAVPAAAAAGAATSPPPTPRSWHRPPPEACAPWMASAPIATGPARPLALVDGPQPAGERSVQFVQVGASNQVDLIGAQHNRLRISLIHAPHGLLIQLKGLTCFVANVGGRPSPAVQIERPGDLALVTPRAQEIGHLRVATGTPEPGQLVFTIGSERVSVATTDCADPILFDFGPGSDAYFVYTRGRTVPRSRRG